VRVEECFRRRLLREERTGPGLWERALEISREKMKRAIDLLRDGYYEESILQSYTSMFHAARAILFRDNIIEKSHVCVISYLEEMYSPDLGLDMISWLDQNRIERHEVIYGMDQIVKLEEEAQLSKDRCVVFVERITNLLMKNTP